MSLSDNFIKRPVLTTVCSILIVLVGLIAIPVAGAYHLSMSSNYNGARRPEVLMLEEGKAKLVIRRETTEDLLRRDSVD